MVCGIWVIISPLRGAAAVAPSRNSPTYWQLVLASNRNSEVHEPPGNFRLRFAPLVAGSPFWRLRDYPEVGRGRHGRVVPRPRHKTQPRSRHQDSFSGARFSAGNLVALR